MWCLWRCLASPCEGQLLLLPPPALFRFQWVYTEALSSLGNCKCTIESLRTSQHETEYAGVLEFALHNVILGVSFTALLFLMRLYIIISLHFSSPLSFLSCCTMLVIHIAINHLLMNPLPLLGVRHILILSSCREPVPGISWN